MLRPRLPEAGIEQAPRIDAKHGAVPSEAVIERVQVGTVGSQEVADGAPEFFAAASRWLSML